MAVAPLRLVRRLQEAQERSSKPGPIRQQLYTAVYTTVVTFSIFEVDEKEAVPVEESDVFRLVLGAVVDGLLEQNVRVVRKEGQDFARH